MTSNMDIIKVLQNKQSFFEPVVKFNPEEDKLIQLDFTAANPALTDELLNDTQLFTHHIHEVLAAANARYGIGGYGEHRTVYRRSTVFDAGDKSEEPRRLHLGIDIWGKPNTAIAAPLEGRVHSFNFNNKVGDYGATIMLTHQLDDCIFYTLYGHLSLNSIKNLQEGQFIEKGELFADFGIPAENGSWPPHLHFQIILDPGENKGDYPGVCKFSEKEKWLANCPNPDLILQMNQFV